MEKTPATGATRTLLILVSTSATGASGDRIEGEATSDRLRTYERVSSAREFEGEGTNQMAAPTRNARELARRCET